MRATQSSKAYPPFDLKIIEATAKTLCNSSEFLSHGGIDRSFVALGLKEVNPSRTSYPRTKWIRVYNTLVGYQSRTGTGQCVVQFIEHCLHPGGFTAKPALFEQVRSEMNEHLTFVGLQVSSEGKVVPGSVATTLDEAARLADSIMAELRRRSVHPDVLKYCTRELLQKDLFHGVHESTKGVFERLRQATGETGDGAGLAEKTLSVGNGVPIVAINACMTESDKSEQRGFCNLVIGATGIWRNTTAHRLRLTSDLDRLEVLEAMTTLSYIHRRLDSAIVTQSGTRVP